MICLNILQQSSPPGLTCLQINWIRATVPYQWQIAQWQKGGWERRILSRRGWIHSKHQSKLTQLNNTLHYLWMQTSRDTADGSLKKKNNVADALSWEWHCSNAALTNILRSLFCKQIPAHFAILPLPSKISSLLISLLWLLPINELLREEHMMANLEPGGNGENTAHQFDAATFSWTNSLNKNKFACSEHLQWLSGQDNYLGNVIGYWAEGTFWGTISHVVQTFRANGRQNPTKDGDLEHSILL
jgi:hypothetical protein